MSVLDEDKVLGAETGEELRFEAEFDAPPEKVWRAVTEPALRDHWLPDGELADPEPIAERPGEEVSYRMRDDEPPFLESLVTFKLQPNGEGGTRFTITHRVDDVRLAATVPRAANDDMPPMMRAA